MSSSVELLDHFNNTLLQGIFSVGGGEVKDDDVFWVAGSSPTTLSVSWMILYLDWLVQKRLEEEGKLTTL